MCILRNFGLGILLTISLSVYATGLTNLPSTNHLDSEDIQKSQIQINKANIYAINNPRKKFVGVTMERRFGLYVEDCLRKILDISQVAVSGQTLGNYGQVQLTFEIAANGAIHSIEINKSSGNKALDDTVINIVKLASPFKKFPDEIYKDIDVLGITRTL